MIAGDLTGKALIAVVKGGGGDVWAATVLGQRREARDEAELVALERSIADVGYYAVRVTRGRAGGDGSRSGARQAGLPRADQRSPREWIALAADRLEGSGVPVYVMPGNDDDFEIDPVLAESTYLQDVNERVVDLTPWHQLVSMGWSSPTPWSTPRELPEEEFLDRLSGADERRPRPPQDGDDDPRPALRLGPRHRAAAVARPAPDGQRRRPAARTGRLDRRAGGDRTVQAGPGRRMAISTSRAANGGSATRSASTPDPSRRWASCAAT